MRADCRFTGEFIDLALCVKPDALPIWRFSPWFSLTDWLSEWKDWPRWVYPQSQPPLVLAEFTLGCVGGVLFPQLHFSKHFSNAVARVLESFSVPLQGCLARPGFSICRTYSWSAESSPPETSLPVSGIPKSRPSIIKFKRPLNSLSLFRFG